MSGFSELIRQRRVQVVGGVVVVVIVAAVASLALAGGKGGGAATATTRGASSTTTIAKKPRAVIAPLTGVPDPTGGAAHRPALTVKIENTNLADPQKGLEQADVVYEEVVEYGITRLLAIYQSQVPPVVGPVRSVRRTDQGVVTPIGGIFVYSGGAAYAISSIQTAPVNIVDETRAGAAMFRDHSRKAPSNLYGIPSKLFAMGGKPVPPPPLFSYRKAHQKVAGPLVTHVGVGFGAGFSVSWQWDAAHGAWTRAVDDPGLAASGTHVAPASVIVMLVNYAGGVGVIGAEAQLVGQGNAVIFTAGHRIDGRWVRPDRAKPAKFVTSTGATIALTPGQTWVELAPVGTPITSF